LSVNLIELASDSAADVSVPLTLDDEVAAFRKKLSLFVKGSNIPAPSTSFKEMEIVPRIKGTILKNIEASDWKEPTPIQMQGEAPLANAI